MLKFQGFSRNTSQRYLDLYAFLSIALTVALLYAQTLQVPWYLDDLPAIVENLAIRDLPGAAAGLFSPRGVAYFTFALNYHFGGLAPAGFHLVNIIIHVLAAYLVFLLLQRVVPGRSVLALAGALLFAVHPLQTQAVTYVVQRMASLSALLVFLSLYLFTRARERLAAGCRCGAPLHLVWYGGALVAALLAVLTKENAAILPLALLLFARFYLPGEQGWKSLGLYLAPFVLVCGAAALWVTADSLLLPLLGGKSLTAAVATETIASSRHNTPLHYFVTELSVLWIYIRMLFLPVGQALDHSYPIVTSWFTWQNLAALTGLAGLGGLAVYLRQRRPGIACGIAWFFLCLAIESSFIPLDPLFEHRLYLPLFGFLLVILDLVAHLPRPRWGELLLGLLLLVFAVLTWQRNQLWNDPVALYEANLKVAPQSERVMSDLAKYQIDKGEYRQAEALLERALAVNPESVNTYINLMTLYGKEGRLGDAYRIIEQGMKIAPDSAYFQYGLGMIHTLRGELDRALAYTQRALQLNPDFASAYTSLGRILLRQQRFTEAEVAFTRAMVLAPNDPQAPTELGGLLARQNRGDEALAAYGRALALDPEAVPALLQTGLLLVQRGDRGAALNLLERLRRLDPAKADYLATALAGEGR